ncbi:MAG TPA: hypothetical protein VG167_17090 [Verrucomicrobiae bacterium]|nr:hypothetical protein [Verrucomicrobiae bacterium]
MSSDPLETLFPKLKGTAFSRTSPYDPTYNCIAWAADDKRRWWWPDPWQMYYWPDDAPRECTVAAFRAAFGTLGYSHSQTALDDNTKEKVALFCKNGIPTHASRQLDAATWTSKLGPDIDISHELEAISGICYGEVTDILGRSKLT